jgi:hypothetical protein
MELKEGQVVARQDAVTERWQAMTRLEGVLIIMHGLTREEALMKVKDYVYNNRFDGNGLEPDWS